VSEPTDGYNHEHDGSPNNPVRKTPFWVEERRMSIIKQIAAYDDLPDHKFMRSAALPFEECLPSYKCGPVKWSGGYRWFRSPNVICLEKARLVVGIRCQLVTVGGPEDAA
jgi:hypothetical protein